VTAPDVTEAEEPLAASYFNKAVRVGDTVRRSKTGQWTPAIHGLLRHLERAGFDGAPRALGIDDRGREILTFVPGEMVRDILPPADDQARWDALLVAAGDLLRRFHDAAEGYEPPADSQWRHSWFDAETALSVAGSVSPAVAGVVPCHNDPTPGNTVAVGGVPTALIDFDFAHPAPRAWDVAHSMSHFARLPSQDPTLSPEERGRRMSVFCRGYGLKDAADRGGLVDVIVIELTSFIEELETLVAGGDPFALQMWNDNEGARTVREDIAYLLAHRVALESSLTAA
jgi:hypothetical protein